MKITALRKTWFSGASLAAVLLVSGLSPVEARAIADDHTAAHAEQSRDAGEVVNDAWITTKVKSKLLADGDVSGLDVSVETRNNVVHLSGEAESQAQVTRATELARETEGVTRVDATALRVNTATGQVREAVGADRRDAGERRDASERSVQNRDRSTDIADERRASSDEEGRSAGEAVGDAWITTKVKSKLLADSDVSGLDVSVETRNNVVHLSGEAESQAQVTRATELARETEGVTRVDATALRVNTATGQVREAVGMDRSRDRGATPDRNMPEEGRYGDNDNDRGAGEAVSDGWITTKVKSKLLADRDVSGFDISVETRDNVVHLSGAVETQAQIDEAVRLAAETEGVARVDATGLTLGGE